MEIETHYGGRVLEHPDIVRFGHAVSPVPFLRNLAGELAVESVTWVVECLIVFHRLYIGVLMMADDEELFVIGGRAFCVPEFPSL